MWAGRFSKETDSRVNDFNSSISFDCRMFREDIGGSMAHAEMLGKCGIIQKEESIAIIAGLKEILQDIENGRLLFDPDAEDIHMFVEAELTRRIGSAGKRLHTARSRNDQVALDLRLYLRAEITEIKAALSGLIQTLAKKADENLTAIMPGYTHLQRAQPVTFAHHLLAYAQMFARDLTRLSDCAKRMNCSPLGCGALATTTYSIDRSMTADLLGFSAPTANSLDGVSDRDFVIELAGALSIVMMHLSRFSEEIVLWCSWEFKFIELDDAYATGSSIMPQKKNPDVAELVRGKTGRVYGDLIALLTVMKGLPLAYNKDMQEDKEAVFDAIDQVKLCVSTFAPMVETMTVLKDHMRQAASKGFINATDCAYYLTKKGIPFRDAYKITGSLVAYCIEKGKTLEVLELAEYRKFCSEFDEGVYQAISLDRCVSGRSVQGGPAPGVGETAAETNQCAAGGVPKTGFYRGIISISFLKTRAFRRRFTGCAIWRGIIMKFKIFVDGQEGTTGLKIYERLGLQEQIDVLAITPALRKDPSERRRLLNQADVAFLCLPDAASREAVSMIENENTRVIDSSTAFRCDPGWVYGFPELDRSQRDKIIHAKRVAVPGCHATGFHSIVHPLVTGGLIETSYPLTCHSVSGYSGGGKKLIARYEQVQTGDSGHEQSLRGLRYYALGLRHKHLAEMRYVNGLDRPPLFTPSVGDFSRGMLVTVPLWKNQMKKPMGAAEVRDYYAEYYQGEKFIRVMPFDSERFLEDGFLDAMGCNGTNSLELFVFGHDDQMFIVSRLDNLGKGASGAAVQCMNLMLGQREDAGLF
ncbi:MAG TPA: argininosuccinate lyase [Clostridia bacterium]|nr:argininosuccinate lyase [Clostridia bacterium]